MKGLKKLLTGILAATMIMGSCLTVAAAEDTTGGTITIESTEKDTKYDFYRVFDLEPALDADGKADYDRVVYTISEGWEAFFSDAGKDYISDSNNEAKSLNPIRINGTTKYINITENNVVDFTNAAMKFALSNSGLVKETVTGDGNDDTTKTLPLGYYLMVPVDASIETSESHGSLASIDSLTPNAKLKVKAKKPGIEKTDDVVSADIGQVVHYTITGKVPNTAGYETYKYLISDEMTSGLTFKNDVVVKIGDAVITDNCSISPEENGFVADIPVTQYQDKIGATITLSYTAVVNENAVEKAQEKNKAQLKYGHNPDDLEEGLPVEEEVYSAKITVDKFDLKDTTKKLAGAKFALMNQEGKYYHLVAATENEDAKVEWKAVDGAPTDGTKAFTDDQAKAIEDAGETITTYETDANGAAEFKGLADGTYYLVEFVAPLGYNRLDTPKMVQINGNDVDNGTEHLENVAYAGQTEFDSHNNAIGEVGNNTGSILPSTGGIGTTIFYVLGGILIAAGVAYFILRRKSNAQ